MAVQGDFMYLRNIKFYFVNTRPLLASLCLFPNGSDPFTVFNTFSDKEDATNSISSLPEQWTWALSTAIRGALGARKRAAGCWGRWTAPEIERIEPNEAQGK